MTQAGLRANMGDRASTCMFLRGTTKLVNACQMAPGLAWKGGKYDLRDGTQETQEVFPNIFPATDCEALCKVHLPPHFHQAFM